MCVCVCVCLCSLHSILYFFLFPIDRPFSDYNFLLNDVAQIIYPQIVADYIVF